MNANPVEEKPVKPSRKVRPNYRPERSRGGPLDSIHPAVSMALQRFLEKGFARNGPLP